MIDLSLDVQLGVIEMVNWFRILAAARKLGLRDRGHVEYTLMLGKTNAESLVHTLCYTRLRIGISKKTNKAYHYCWRCELILVEDPPPKDREPFPEEENKKGKGPKVIELNSKKAA